MLRRIEVAAAAGVILGAGAAAFAGLPDQVGLDDLIARVGAGNEPTGAGVVVSMVEAPAGSNYAPNVNNPEFDDITLILMSGSSGTSGHADTVAERFFGNLTSIAPGIPTARCYEVNSWAGSGFLRTGQSGAPLPMPGGIKVQNHSWIGSFGSASLDNDALRRTDFVALRDDVLFVVGVNNADPNQPLVSHIYNGLACGKSSGNHAIGDTMSPYDGPGRMKPEITSPANGATSFATPVVGSACTLMVETALGDACLSKNPNAARSEVIKSIILSGATHTAVWTNNPATSGPDRGRTSRPIDNALGAGRVDVNRSHLILTGGQQAGSMDPPASVNASWRGWDLPELDESTSIFYRFAVTSTADEVSIIATWHRQVLSNFVTQFSANVDLTLWRVNAAGALETLVGDDGVPHFGGGNVVSESEVDNIEHLYIEDLEPGEYVLEVARVDGVVTFGDYPVAVSWLFPEPGSIPGDITGDGNVNVSDLLQLLADWGPCSDPCGCPSDLDGSGTVDVEDLLAVLANWG